MILPALLAFAFLQRPIPQTPAARAARLSEFDSSKAVVSRVGAAVAEVRSALDVYRRAVFNGPDDDVLRNADYLRVSCRGLDSVVKADAHAVCRHCAGPQVQAAFDGYRAVLPGLGRTMGQCAQRLSRLASGARAARALRDSVRAVGNPLVLGLRSYEARLGAVRSSLNIPPPPAPARDRPPGGR